MKYLLFIIILLLGCKSEEKLAAERAQMERDYLRTLQGKYADSNYISLPVAVPGGTAVLRLQANCPDFDSGAVKSSAGQLTIQAPCPPVTINADSIIRNSNAYKAALVARGLADAKSDSLLQANAVLKADKDKFKSERNVAYKWLGGLIAGFAIVLLVWWKSGAISGLIKGIFKWN
jgi:hypothetical protein